MKSGAASDWANAKNNPETPAKDGPLIDNLQDDIANGGSIGGQMFTGASVFEGLSSMPSNANFGLYALAN
jgi:hypothetical protein